VLPGTLPAGAADIGREDNYQYSSGVRYDGHEAQATLAIGALAAKAGFQDIERLSCLDTHPNCPIVKPEDVGKRGNSLTGGRFRAVLGINMANADVPNPLMALGVQRWIVELPRPGSDQQGKLILNPTDAEIADFVRLPVLAAYRNQKGGLHDAITGCLVLGKDAKSCGSLLMDTGVSGVLANGPSNLSPPVDGAQAALAFFDSSQLRASESFATGNRDQASRVAVNKQANPMIVAGQLPFFAFDVLYEPGPGDLGLKPRETVAGLPNGSLAAKP
jgi:hypothetical protein